LCGITAVVLSGAAGCAVPQPRGGGQLSREVEPTTRRSYWLYLPRDYVAASDEARRARRWPLVVTFHGMKPFDNARPQALEWEQEADRYGYIVVAPSLLAPDVLQPFPLREVTRAFEQDDHATMAILDDVLARTHADRTNVLATSWSSGGYAAHYMLNRHPDRFTCLAVRQSNFSSGLLDESLADRSQYHPILIIMTKNDFGICKRESHEAIRWYEEHGYKNVWWVTVDALGHARTPDVAGDFFGRLAGVRPSYPPTVLVQRQVIEGNPAGLAFLAGKIPVVAEEPTVAVRNVAAVDSDAGRGQPARSPEPVRSTPAPSRASAPPRDAVQSPVGIRISSAIGTSPLHVGFSAEFPSGWQKTAEFLWTLDGNPLCTGVNGQKTFLRAGVYRLGLLVIRKDGTEHRASRIIRVLTPPNS